MAGTGVCGFHHSGVGVSQQIRNQSGTHSLFFQLRTEGGTPVVVAVFTVDTQLFERTVTANEKNLNFSIECDILQTNIVRINK